MSETSIQDILASVQMPSRYLGNEINRVVKAWDKTRLHVALAFPDLYEIATSHFGIQILYGMLNAQEDILAERVFAPAVDMEAQLRQNRLPLSSLESATALHKFDIIGFSLLYELNYTNMVNMLDLGGVSFFAGQRKEKDPFVIAGGPCTCNPEPVADFFDAIVVGDGEAVILQMTDAWKRWRTSDNGDRQALLRRWSQIKGVYIPSFFEFSEGLDGKRRLIPKKSWHRRVQRAIVPDLNDAPSPAKPIIPFGRPIHDRLRMEIARGCTRGCRFCQAGMIYRPVRERQPEAVLASVSQALRHTGYEDLSLLSLSTGDYSCIAPLMKKIMEAGTKDRVAVSLPSLRAGSLTPELMELIRKVRKTGFTIAPEAGSQRLRDVINKNITESDIVETVENAFSLGWKVIKLYFMVGLPTETQADLVAIVDLINHLRNIIGKKSRRGKINVSVATFVPKPHTPFQWEPQIDLQMALEKINWLKANMNWPGVQIKWQDPRVSMIEGIWARGDRQLGKVLIEAWKKGCRFDGWSDFFDYARWETVFEQAGINRETYTAGFLDPAQPLPWDHIDIGVNRSFLIDERSRAREGKITVDCRTGSCSRCGVCDFKSLRPVSFHDRKNDYADEPSTEHPLTSDASFKYVVHFKKMNEARFLGHLEMIKIFIRSLRRANIPLKYSKGFHPMPKVSFWDTLPMGMQSENEQMLITLTQAMEPYALTTCLSELMPCGLEITGCSVVDKQKGVADEKPRQYRIELKDGFFSQKDLDWFFEQQSISIERKSKKSRPAVVDLKKSVLDIKLLNNRHACVTIGRTTSLMVRPVQVMKTVFKLTDAQIHAAIVTKQKTDHV